MDYNQDIINIGELKARIAELVAGGYVNPPEDSDDDAEWQRYHEMERLQHVEHDLDYCWHNNTTILINERHWQDWCEQYCYDVGTIDKDSFLCQFIDWESVSDYMQQDYRRVDIGIYTFLVRA